MIIKVLTSEIQEAIKKVNNIQDNKENPSPGILLTSEGYSNLIVQKANAISEIKTTINQVEIIENGSLFIPQTTIKLIEKLKNVTYLEITKEYIQADKKKIKYNPLAVKDYYNQNVVIDIPDFTVSEKELARLLSVKYAIAKDQTRPILNGVNIQENRFAALDGYILSVRESSQFNTDLNITIAAETVKILDKLVSKKSENIVKIFYSENINGNNATANYIKFVIDNTEITSKLLEGEYIKYKSIIPEEHTTNIELNSNLLTENMEFLKNIKTDITVFTRFNIDNDTNIFTVSGSSMENTIEDEVACTIEGKSLLIGFNAEFMLQVLKQYKDKNISMNFTSSVSPGVIKESNTSKNYNLDLVLPVRMPA